MLKQLIDIFRIGKKKRKTPEEWLQKYYPVPSEKCPRDDMFILIHALIKWIGLDRDILDEYGLVQQGKTIYSGRHPYSRLIVKHVFCAWNMDATKITIAQYT